MRKARENGEGGKGRGEGRVEACDEAGAGDFARGGVRDAVRSARDGDVANFGAYGLFRRRAGSRG